MFIFFSTITYHQVSIYGDVEYSDSKVKNDLEAMTNAIEDLPLVGERIFTDSWLREVSTFLEDNPEIIPSNSSIRDAFADVILEVLYSYMR